LARPEEELATNDLVFHGRVRAIRSVLGCGSRVVVEFDVLEGFRGVADGDDVGVSARGTGGGDCGLARAFEVGDELVVFADAEDPWLSACSPYVLAPDGATTSARPRQAREC
jgi:hypothetical protein